jgi:hypothetical protein
MAALSAGTNSARHIIESNRRKETVTILFITDSLNFFGGKGKKAIIFIILKIHTSQFIAGTYIRYHLFNHDNCKNIQKMQKRAFTARF